MRSWNNRIGWKIRKSRRDYGRKDRIGDKQRGEEIMEVGQWVNNKKVKDIMEVGQRINNKKVDKIMKIEKRKRKYWTGTGRQQFGGRRVERLEENGWDDS